MGKIGPDGQFETITQAGREAAQDRKEKELDRPPTPEHDLHPPAKTDPGPDPGKVNVDEFVVEQIGLENLPGAAEADDYRAQARDGVFARLATAVLDSSGVDLKQLEDTLTKLVAAVDKARKDLDTKTEATAPPQTPAVAFEPLPGVADDPVCRSRFDVNDLALTGKKAVTVRQYNQPLVMLDAELVPRGTAKPWLVGQKLEFGQEWRHEGFTLGELVSSLSLLPSEELSIEVSSYQRTRQEIQTEKDDTRRTELLNEQRNTDERSCTNQTAASNGWSVSATASVNYPVASASLSASAFGNSSEQAQDSRRQLTESTARTASDVSSRRAVKITQTTEAGSESTTTRRLRNPNGCQTLTFNFFQVIKLYDVQLRLGSDRPVFLLPGIFPRFYGPQEVRKGELPGEIRPTEVTIPTHAVEGWRAPAVFLTKYLEVDRELSTQISGWALRLRADVASDPVAAVRLLAEALVVVARYLFQLDPNAVVAMLGRTLSQFCAAFSNTRTRAAAGYGPGLGTTLQVNTPGIYVDALRGRCTGCTDHEESGQYVDVMTKLEELRRLRSANQLDEQEVSRRKRRLEGNDLDPFEPLVPATP
jgi:hypothetical protein